MLRLLNGFVLLALCLPVVAQAEEDHGIGKIVTEELDLTYIDHVLTGRVGDRPVFAKPLEDQFGMYLWHRAEGENFESQLVREGDGFTGGIESVSPQEEIINAQFIVTEIDGVNGTIAGTLAGRSFVVQVSAEEMNGHHFVEPLFEVTFSDGGSYQFKLAGGQACMGCALKLSYAILSMLHGYGTLL